MFFDVMDTFGRLREGSKDESCLDVTASQYKAGRLDPGKWNPVEGGYKVQMDGLNFSLTFNDDG